MSESSARSTLTEEDLLIELQERGSYQVAQIALDRVDDVSIVQHREINAFLVLIAQAG